MGYPEFRGIVPGVVSAVVPISIKLIPMVGMGDLNDEI